jgi:hypothetical protein
MSNFPVDSPQNPINFSTTGSNSESSFNPSVILSGQRYTNLAFKESFYEGKQHDHKAYNIEGCAVTDRSSPLSASAPAPFTVPILDRRPSAPYRLPKKIVDAFTALLFSDGRFPSLLAPGDAEATDFASAIAKFGELAHAMIQCRMYGGNSGTAAISWCYDNGVPRFETHQAKNLFVHSWRDRNKLMLRHVSEVYVIHKTGWNGREFAEIPYWYRRDWTPDADIIFKTVPAEAGKMPEWVVDVERTVEHKDGITHMEWIQNIPAKGVDGQSDYENMWSQFDSLDALNSTTTYGATKNSDPTLVLGMDPEEVSRGGIKKGSDNALIVGESGSAEYLELSGTSIEAGAKQVATIRSQILECTACVIPDAEQLAAQGMSSVAIRAIYAPMLAQCDILRTQYGRSIKNIVQNMLKVARANAGKTILVQRDGMQVEARLSTMMPPRVVETDIALPDGTVQKQVQYVERNPGKSEELDLIWPDYFPPTPADQSATAMTLQTSTGGKAFVSKQGASEVMARQLGLDPVKEWERINAQAAKEKAAAAEEAAGMFPPFETPKPGAHAPPAAGDEEDDEEDDEI